MPNEFKVRNGLVINNSGSTALEIQGAQGQLATVTDLLSGSLYSIDDISGIPILEVISDNVVNIGTFRNEGIKVSGSFAIITGSLRGTASISSFSLSASNALSSSFALFSSYASSSANALFVTTASFVPITTEFPFTGSAQVSGSVFVTGSSQITGSLSVTGSVGFTYTNINGTWNAGSNIINDRSCLAGAGEQNAALAFGGAPGVACTEAYNGSTWSSRNAMINAARNALAGVGTQNAALGFGGYGNNLTEAYNGINWAARNSMNVAKGGLGGAGTQGDALGFNGQLTVSTEQYNGATWSIRANSITPRSNLSAGVGASSNAALLFGGEQPAGIPITNTEAYDGTSWSTRNGMNTSRSAIGKAGSQNSALAWGGRSNPTGTRLSSLEEYNGVSWTIRSSLAGNVYRIGSVGTTVAALSFAGSIGASTCIFNKIIQTFNSSPLTGNVTIGNTFSPSSLNVTGSMNVSGSVVNNLTSSFAVTSSFAYNVIPIISKTLTITGTPTIQAADVITYPMWRVPSPVTASLISVYSISSLATSGSQVNASKNSSLLLATPLTLTSSVWVSSSALQNQNFVAGDILSFNFLSLTGSLTSVIVQVDFIK